MIGIYKITNKTNGMCYIGQSISCIRRFYQHTKRLDNYIDEVIRDEGIENFTFEILKITKKEDLSIWEDYYINKYWSMFPNGYNKKWNDLKVLNKAIKLIKEEKEKGNLSSEEEIFEQLLNNNEFEVEKKIKPEILDFDRNDLSTLFLPDKYLDIPLDKESKKELSNFICFRNSCGHKVGWPTTKKRLIEAGYEIKDVKHRINGKQTSCSIISFKEEELD